jgi:Amt family ammonium transporter
MVKKMLYATGIMSLLFPTLAFAADDPVATVSLSLDSLWVMVAAVLVLLMQGGFILLEVGSTRMKNAGHVAGKTIFATGLCTLVFWAVGYSLIFTEGTSLLGGLSEAFFNPSKIVEGGIAGTSIFFLFQLAFAAVSLSIAWGGFAERAKLSVYLIFTIIFGVVIYPVIAHWIWGGGWLASHGKQDFAGSTVVHLTGAAAALAATILLKPRIGKYNKDGTVNAIQGHNQVFSTVSVLLLWVGWFGFNAGSTVAVGDGFFGYVAFNTQLAAGAGAVAALIVSWIFLGKADIPTMLNGALAGLVAITASCAFVEPWAAVVIGIVAGGLMYFTMKFFDKVKVDDPVGVLSVHGVAGIIGTLSTGFFATGELAEKVGVGKAGLFYGGGVDQLVVQLYGVITSGVFAFVVSFAALWLIKKAIGLRVTEEEEVIGLDLSEHGSYGYPEQMKKAGTGYNVTG